MRVRELAIWAATETVGATERDAIATEIDSLRLRMLDAANALDSSGNAVFGGEGNGRAYDVDGMGAITYVGTATSGTT